jgi:hypothetical protein
VSDFFNDYRYWVTFTSDSNLSVTVLLDANSPYITGGYGGWEIIDRPKRVGLTRYRGREPFRQDISILFDGAANEDSQEINISDLSRMAEQPGALQPPPTVRIDGTVLREDLVWVIENITWDSNNVMWSYAGGTPFRIRQSAVVHLLQFVDDEVIVTAPSPAIAAKPTTPTTKIEVPEGMNLRQVAQANYGDPDKYIMIIVANPWLDPDPRAIIPSGTVITIPGKLIYKVPGGSDTSQSQQKSSAPNANARRTNR